MKFERIALLVVFGALIVAQLIWMPKAGADPNEQAFVVEATQAGFQINDMSGLILYSKVGCTNAIRYHNPHLVADQLWRGSPGLSEQGVTQLAIIAIRNFCPIVFTYSGTQGTYI